MLGTRKLIPLGAIVLLGLCGCKHSSAGARATNNILKGVTPIRVSLGDADAAEPAIAATADGAYVVWVEHHEKSEADVMIARFDSAGTMRGSATRVNTQPGIATAWRGDPPTVVVTPDGQIHVGWTGRVETPTGHAANIYLSTSSDAGKSFGPPIKVNDDPKPAMHGMHSLAIGAGGLVYMAWLDERNLSPMPAKDANMSAKTSGHHMESNREVFVATSSDGGRSFTPNRRVATNVCPCCKTSLAVAQDGRLYLSWRQVLPGDFRHISVASSNDAGKTFSPAVIVSDDQWALAGCPVSGASLAVDHDGKLSALWYAAGQKGEQGIYSSESRDNGRTFAPRHLVATTFARGTPVFIKSDRQSAAIWEQDQGSNGQVMTAGLAGEPKNLIIAADGQVPAAAISRDKVFVAYIAKTGAHQEVFVVPVTASLLNGKQSD